MLIVLETFLVKYCIQAYFIAILEVAIGAACSALCVRDSLYLMCDCLFEPYFLVLSLSSHPLLLQSRKVRKHHNGKP